MIFILLLQLAFIHFVHSTDGVNVNAAGTAPSLVDDPSLFPGHLEPLGAKQPQAEIETLTEYPSPKDFFLKYIRPGRPFLLKGGAKYQRAYKLWTDKYMAEFPEAATEKVTVEPNKKEIRDANGFETSFKDFVGRYKDEKIYMVNKLPTFLQKDVMMPPPLRCNNTRSLMLDHVTWMSSGGTKSVLHQDDLDNINCLFRGTKDLLFINPITHGSKVPIDKPKGGYSSLDVDKVNFTKYPSMRYVEYTKCHMEEGDCLFIPWAWYHQVNSVSNEDKQNIAVNIWFKHDAKHVPEECDVPEEKASLDHYYFPGMDSLDSDGDDKGEGDNETEDEEEEDESFQNLKMIKWSLTHTKHTRAGFKTFLSLLKKIPDLVTTESINHLQLSKEFLETAKLMFDKLNIDGDKFLTNKDFEAMATAGKEEEIETFCSSQFRNLQVIATNLLIDQPEPLEEDMGKATDIEPKITTNEKKEEL